MTCSGTIGDCDISGSFPEEKSITFFFLTGHEVWLSIPLQGRSAYIFLSSCRRSMEGFI